jgi:hypothetical protein
MGWPRRGTLQHPRDEQGHDDDENDVAAGERSPQQEPHDRERDHDRADEDPVPAQPPAEPAGLETAPASPSFGSWARYVIGLVRRRISSPTTS